MLFTVQEKYPTERALVFSVVLYIENYEWTSKIFLINNILLLFVDQLEVSALFAGRTSKIEIKLKSYQHQRWTPPTVQRIPAADREPSLWVA